MRGKILEKENNRIKRDTHTHIQRLVATKPLKTSETTMLLLKNLKGGAFFGYRKGKCDENNRNKRAACDLQVSFCFEKEGRTENLFLQS